MITKHKKIVLFLSKEKGVVRFEYFKIRYFFIKIKNLMFFFCL